MNRKLALLIVFFLLVQAKLMAQTPAFNLPNLNNWNSTAGFFEWYETLLNVPAGQSYGNGIQMVLASDNRFGAQLVIPTADNQVYYRRRSGGDVWDPWIKIWSSANLNTLQHDFSAKNLTMAGIFQTYNRYSPEATYDNLQIYTAGTNSIIESNGDEEGLIIRSNTGHKILFMDQVGIGTMLPTEKLSVNGNIRAKEVKVTTENWPDYVFEDGYEITPLAQLDAYIKVHKHLPDLPSAKEAETNGIALGEMNKLLLKKIEELTLHLIEKDAGLTAEKKLNQEQARQLKTLELHIQTINARLDQLIKN